MHALQLFRDMIMTGKRLALDIQNMQNSEDYQIATRQLNNLQLPWQEQKWCKTCRIYIFGKLNLNQRRGTQRPGSDISCPSFLQPKRKKKKKCLKARKALQMRKIIF